MNSGGKDSMATCLLAWLYGIKVDRVCWCEVMFDKEKNISGEHPLHRDFMYNKAIPFLEKTCGFKVDVIRADKDFLDCFYHRKVRGKYVGKINGWPLGSRCCIQRDLKLAPIKKYLKQFKEYTEIIGIASDEPKRLETMWKQKNKISLLQKFGFTENAAMELCKTYGLLSPIYEFSKRNGCWFCPNQRINEFKQIYKNYPSLIEELKKLDKTPDQCSPLFTRTKTLTEMIDNCNK